MIPFLPVDSTTDISLRLIFHRNIVIIKDGDSGSINHILMDTISFQRAGVGSIPQWDSSVGFLKSYFFECKSGRNSIKVAEKWT